MTHTRAITRSSSSAGAQVPLPGTGGGAHGRDSSRSRSATTTPSASAGAAASSSSASVSRKHGDDAMSRSLQELRELRPLLVDAASYAEQTYGIAERKDLEVNNAREYIVSMLVGVVDRLGACASRLTDELEREVDAVASADLHVTAAAQRVRACWEYAGCNALSHLQMARPHPPHDHYRSLPLPSIEDPAHAAATRDAASTMGAAVQSTLPSPSLAGEAAAAAAAGRDAAGFAPTTDSTPPPPRRSAAGHAAQRLTVPSVAQSLAVLSGPREWRGGGVPPSPLSTSATLVFSPAASPGEGYSAEGGGVGVKGEGGGRREWVASMMMMRNGPANAVPSGSPQHQHGGVVSPIWGLPPEQTSGPSGEGMPLVSQSSAGGISGGSSGKRRTRKREILRSLFSHAVPTMLASSSSAPSAQTRSQEQHFSPPPS